MQFIEDKINLVVFNLKHTKYKKKRCVFAWGGGDARNPPESKRGDSLEKFENH